MIVFLYENVTPVHGIGPFVPQNVITYGEISLFNFALKGTSRIQSKNGGLKINGLNYWTDFYNDPKYEGKVVQVRY